MREVADKVMQTFGPMKSLTPDEAEETREVLLDFLSKRPGDDDHTATVESLKFLPSLKSKAQIIACAPDHATISRRPKVVEGYAEMYRQYCEIICSNANAAS